MLRALAFWAFAGLVVPARAEPPASPLPSIVESGFAHLQSFGPEQAIRTWSRDSKVLTPESLAPFQDKLIKLRRPLGAFRNFDPIGAKPSGGGSSLFWIAARFEHGTLFFRFLVFEDRLVNQLDCSSEPAEIVPPELLETLGAPPSQLTSN